MKLYKYVSAERWKDILKDNLIRFTQPSVFNDPFELQPFYEITEDKEGLTRSAAEEARNPDFFTPYVEQAHNQLPTDVQRFISPETLKALIPLIFSNVNVEAAMPEVLAGLTSAMRSGMHQGFDNAVGILSLTTDSKNLLMWAHYAQNHQGLVIEFDSSHPFFDIRRTPDDEFGYLREVIYQAERPKVIFTQLEDFAPILLTKSQEWKYEVEWRMLRPLTGMAKVGDNEGEKIYLFDLPSSCIKRVILGYRMNTNLKKEITDFLKSADRYTSIDKDEVFLDEQEFALNFKPIKD
jgi:hypothetical protein